MLVLHYHREPGAQKEEGGLCAVVLTPGSFIGDPGLLSSPLAHCFPSPSLSTPASNSPLPLASQAPASSLISCLASAHSLCLVLSPFCLPCWLTPSSRSGLEASADQQAWMGYPQVCLHLGTPLFTCLQFSCEL